jgi:hypothetical protein
VFVMTLVALFGEAEVAVVVKVAIASASPSTGASGGTNSTIRASPANLTQSVVLRCVCVCAYRACKACVCKACLCICGVTSAVGLDELLRGALLGLLGPLGGLPTHLIRNQADR